MTVVDRTALPLSVPPVASTRPSGNNTATSPIRSAGIDAAAVNIPVAGSYSSAVARPVGVAVPGGPPNPPMTSTLPLVSATATCCVRPPIARIFPSGRLAAANSSGTWTPTGAVLAAGGSRRLPVVASSCRRWESLIRPLIEDFCHRKDAVNGLSTGDENPPVRQRRRGLCCAHRSELTDVRPPLRRVTTAGNHESGKREAHGDVPTQTTDRGQVAGTTSAVASYAP